LNFTPIALRSSTLYSCLRQRSKQSTNSSKALKETSISKIFSNFLYSRKKHNYFLKK